jgi:pimeloyl-ACP methyl ester carboxylesterase
MKNQTNIEFKKEFVISNDGTNISYKVMGQGPGLLIVHGGFRASQHYLRLANYLSNAFTVYIIDRRGRNDSGPKGSDYSVQKECEDVIAILQKHNVSFLFGHSYGGLVSLNVAIQYPLAKLAVYEPAGISKNNPFPTDWLPLFEEEIKEKDYTSASVTFLKGLKMGGIIGKMPKPILKVLLRAMAKGPEWEENIPLLLELPAEIRAALEQEASIARYQQISAETLVLSGTKSPVFLIAVAHELASILPNRQSMSLEGLDHNAPDEHVPEKIAQILKDFFV